MQLNTKFVEFDSFDLPLHLLAHHLKIFQLLVARL